MKKPVILQLIGGLTSGGAEAIVINLTNRLKKDNWNVIISARSDGPLSAQLIDRNCIYFIQKNRTIDFRYFLKLVSLIRKQNVDLIHSHLFGNNFYGFIAAKFTGVKIVQTIHGMDCIKSRRRIFVYNAMAPFVDKIVTVSEALEQQILKKIFIGKDKICTMANGIDLGTYVSDIDIQRMKEETGLSDSFPIIGAVGNVKPVKDYETYIRALCLTLKKYPNAKFLIVGDTNENVSYKAKLDTLIFDLNLQRHVEFLGFRQDAHELLSIFDVYVLPSKSEGLSLALLEAMALAKPIVATSVGGNVYVLENKKNALLVPPQNPGALADAILKLLSDESLARSIGANAFEKVRTKYSLKRMVEDFKKLYISLRRK